MNQIYDIPQSESTFVNVSFYLYQRFACRSLANIRTRRHHPRHIPRRDGMRKREKGRNPLCKEILGRMLNVVIRERRHGVITMVVIRLVPNLDPRDSCFLRRLLQVLGEKLALLVEVVAGSLHLLVHPVRVRNPSWWEHTTSIKTSTSFPFHPFTNSDASCSFHVSLFSSPRYPPNAFCPQGQLIGFEMGANAETLLYLPGLRRKSVSAP